MGVSRTRINNESGVQPPDLKYTKNKKFKFPFVQSQTSTEHPYNLLWVIDKNQSFL